MNIVKAQQKDTHAIFSLIKTSGDLLRKQGIDQWDDSYPTFEHIAEAVAAGFVWIGILEHIPDSASECLPASSKDPKPYTIIGTITLGAQTSAFAHAHISWNMTETGELFVNRLCIAPAYRGKGFAHQLLQFAEKQAVSRGIYSLRFDTHPENSPMLHLFAVRGASQVGEVSYEGRAVHYLVFELVLPRPILKLQEPANSYTALHRACLTIRNVVFTGEQGVDPAIDEDGLDLSLYHMLITYKDKPAGCLRLKPEGSSLRLQRLAVLPEFRGYHFAKTLVREALSFARRYGYREVTMHAQYYLLSYYEALGFMQRGDIFLEANIRHIEMSQKVEAES